MRVGRYATRETSPVLRKMAQTYSTCSLRFQDSKYLGHSRMIRAGMASAKRNAALQARVAGLCALKPPGVSITGRTAVESIKNHDSVFDARK